MTGIDDVRRAGQSIWQDDIQRSMLDSGELERRRDEWAVTGITANPTIFERAISEHEDYDVAIIEQGGRAVEAPVDVFWDLAVDDIQRAADILLPAHEQSGGVDGFVSLELAPGLAYDAQGSIDAGTELFRRLDRPNVMIKVPGTAPGAVAIEELTARGVNVNVTLLFGVAQWSAVWEAFVRGLQRRRDGGEDLAVASVASFFLSRIDHLVADAMPDEQQNQLAVALAKLVHDEWSRRLEEPRWRELAEAGARPQRLLWASTSPKDPALPPTYYVERLVVPDTIDTMSADVIEALSALDHLDAPLLSAASSHDARQVMSAAAAQGIEPEQVADQLQKDGVLAFSESFDDLARCIEHKARVLVP
jgi:transaldolase